METTALKPLRIHLQEFLESSWLQIIKVTEKKHFYAFGDDKQWNEFKSLHSVQRRKRLDKIPHSYASQSSGRKKNCCNISSEQNES